jgi:hypothetical protein
MSKKYQINSKPLILKDETSVKFHVKSGDYFGTIATILSLIEQEIKTNDCLNGVKIKKALKALESDLVYLQKNYQISFKPALQISPSVKNKNKTPKGKLKSQ